MTVEELKKRIVEERIYEKIFEPEREHVGALYEIETVGYYLLIVAPGRAQLVAARGKHMQGVWYQDIIRRVA